MCVDFVELVAANNCYRSLAQKIKAERDVLRSCGCLPRAHCPCLCINTVDPTMENHGWSKKKHKKQYKTENPVIGQNDDLYTDRISISNTLPETKQTRCGRDVIRGTYTTLEYGSPFPTFWHDLATSQII